MTLHGSAAGRAAHYRREAEELRHKAWAAEDRDDSARADQLRADAYDATDRADLAEIEAERGGAVAA